LIRHKAAQTKECVHESVGDERKQCHTADMQDAPHRSNAEISTADQLLLNYAPVAVHYVWLSVAKYRSISPSISDEYSRVLGNRAQYGQMQPSITKFGQAQPSMI